MSWNLLTKRRNGAFRPAANGPGCRRRRKPILEQLEDRTLPSIVTPFTVRFSTDNTGDIAIVGNTLETATTVGNPGRTALDVTNAQNGIGANVNNNNWNMAYVDVDGNAATFNSSQATLNLPGGATVLFAGLYWGGNSNSALRNQVLLSTPTSAGYTTINGVVLGDTSPLVPPPNPPGPNYEGFDNVTALVQAGGSGTYTVADVQATAASNTYAGWSLVVAYSVPGDPLRNLTVFDGYGAIQNGEAPVNISVSGFVAPPTGVVSAKVGVVAYEGDLGLVGDQLLLNGTALSDAAHPANNFFDSTIANLGTSISAKNPNFVNQLGFDASVVQAPAGTILNGATSATLTLVTVGDTYFPGALTTAIDLYQPTLASTKTVTDLNGGNVVPGDILQYTINVTNTGQDAAGSVVLNDIIPTNTTYVPGSLLIVSGANAGAQTDPSGDDQAEFAGNQVVFRLGTGANATTGGTLAVGQSTVIQFDVQVSPGTPANTVINNQATIDYLGVTTNFPFTGTSTLATVTTTSPSADLVLAKNVSNRNPNVGDNVTYTVTLTNNGPDAATGVTVTDLLPAGLQFVSASPSQGTYNSSSGLWTVGTVANGASITLTIIAQVTGPTAQTNTATITNSNAFDPNNGNNTASATETPQQADLVLAKTVSNANPNVGDIVTYTVTLTNAGPNTATGVTVADLLPSGLALVSAAPSQGTYNAATGVWTVGSLASGASVTLTITAQVTASTAQTNLATITHSDVFDPNSSNNTASVTETPQQADLVLAKTVSNANPNVGDDVTYMVTLTNAGPNTATGVTVADLLPSGLVLVSAAPSQGTYNAATGVWTVGSLANGTSATLTIIAQVTASTAQTNSATITHSDVFDPNSSNNRASVTETPQQADLVLAKTMSNANPNVGDTVTYTVTLTNNGPDTATGVTVTDLLPAGLQFASASPSQGTYNSSSGLWTVGTVANGASTTLTIIAQVTGPTAQTNTATITNSNAFDPNTGNNSASVTETPQQADLVLAKTVSNANPNVGDNVTYTVTLTNNGPNTATGVAVSDPLPSGLLLVSDSPSQGSYNASSGLWTVGTVANGATVTLTIVAQVTATSPRTNTATISNSNVFDPNSSNNTAGVTESPPSADLVLTKVANQTAATVGQNVTYTLRIRNNGPDAATNVVVTDTLPAGLVFVAAAPPTLGTFNPATGIWTVGTLANGQTAILQLTDQITAAGLSVNSADATSLQFDPDLANNRATATVNGTDPAIMISKRQFLASTFIDPADPVANAAVAVPDLQSAVSFVDNLYNAVLNRAPAPGEADPWVAALDAGVSRQAVIQEVWNSLEHLGLEVDQIYTQILHRAADQAGRAWWVNYLMQGHGENVMELALLGSSEYTATHSSSSSFLQGLYSDMLGRAADAAGFAAWLQALQGGTDRAMVARAFVNSAEAAANVVNRDYTQFLLRPADAAGRNAWVAAEQSGALTLGQVSEGILASDEFFALP